MSYVPLYIVLTNIAIWRLLDMLNISMTGGGDIQRETGGDAPGPRAADLVSLTPTPTSHLLLCGSISIL